MAGAVALLGPRVAALLGEETPQGRNVVAPPTGALFGAHVSVPGEESAELSAVESFETEIGRTLDIAHHFYRFDKEFPTELERADLAAGRLPLISWNGTLTQEITAGVHDELISTRADAIRSLGQPVLLRWMWEMDGRSKAEDVNSPADYIAAWKHIRRIFLARGAVNAQWVWCPNASAFKEKGDGPAYYPGDSDVDWICGDGYNWAPGRAGDEWESFSEIFQPLYAWARDKGKPIMIGEYGAQERTPGEKAKWIDDARQTVKKEFPLVRAVVYFHANKNYDWRVNTSEDALRAFVEMGRDGYFDPPVRPILEP
ncbi:MAG: glycoside hydrolase family 26 protein [Acidimicrobiia bacterium]